MENKIMVYHKFSRILVPALFLLCLQGYAQTDAAQEKIDKHTQLKSLIDSKKYHFHALSVTPMRGGTRQLTSEYGFKIDNDSLSVFLPYFGRAYSVDYGSTDLSIRFRTKEFSYVADTTKKGGWEITIIPKGQANANKIYMSVTSSGYCNVQVNSNNRDPISFYGNINAFNDR
jgi:Domain of unknown function (DUF4251)